MVRYCLFFFFSPYFRAHNTLAVGPFSNIKGLTYYKDNEEDPYITLQDVCCMIYAHT